MAWGQVFAGARQHLATATPAALAGAERAGEHLAVHAAELAVQLSNRIFTGFDNIVDLCCDAWNRLTDQPWKIVSIAYRQWTVAG